MTYKELVDSMSIFQLRDALEDIYGRINVTKTYKDGERIWIIASSKKIKVGNKNLKVSMTDEEVRNFLASWYVLLEDFKTNLQSNEILS